jgi:hypothetical protein
MPEKENLTILNPDEHINIQHDADVVKKAIQNLWPEVSSVTLEKKANIIFFSISIGKKGITVVYSIEITNAVVSRLDFKNWFLTRAQAAVGLPGPSDEK